MNIREYRERLESIANGLIEADRVLREELMSAISDARVGVAGCYGEVQGKDDEAEAIPEEPDGLFQFFEVHETDLEMAVYNLQDALKSATSGIACILDKIIEHNKQL